VTGEAVSADIVGATEFPKALVEIIKNEDYLPQQFFNVNETGLWWKKMPDHCYILVVKEEKPVPGFKVLKNRLMLLPGENAAGDCKIELLLVYQLQRLHCLLDRNPIQRHGWLKSVSKIGFYIILCMRPKNIARKITYHLRSCCRLTMPRVTQQPCVTIMDTSR
jgi:hypothetical protein